MLPLWRLKTRLQQLKIDADAVNRQAEAQREKDIEVGTFAAGELRKQTVSEAIATAQTAKQTARNTRDDTIAAAIIAVDEQKELDIANVSDGNAEEVRAQALDAAQQDDGERSRVDAAQDAYDSTVVTQTATAEVTRQQSIATAWRTLKMFIRRR